MPSVLGAGMQDVPMLVSKGTAAQTDSGGANFACPVLLLAGVPLLASIENEACRPHDQDRQQGPSLPIINRFSLVSNAQVVNSLAKNQPHVTFRQTKLTSVLKDALGGNCKTVMIACCWPEEEFLEETLSTLRFALRVKSLTTTATVSEKTDPATLIRCGRAASCSGSWRRISATPDCLDIVIVAGRSLDPLAWWAAEQTYAVLLKVESLRGGTGKARLETSNKFTQCSGPLCGAKHRSK
jgi:hypothetical protein